MTDARLTPTLRALADALGRIADLPKPPLVSSAYWDGQQRIKMHAVAALQLLGRPLAAFPVPMMHDVDAIVNALQAAGFAGATATDPYTQLIAVARGEAMPAGRDREEQRWTPR